MNKDIVCESCGVVIEDFEEAYCAGGHPLKYYCPDCMDTLCICDGCGTVVVPEDIYMTKDQFEMCPSCFITYLKNQACIRDMIFDDKRTRVEGWYLVYLPPYSDISWVRCNDLWAVYNTIMQYPVAQYLVIEEDE